MPLKPHITLESSSRSRFTQKMVFVDRYGKCQIIAFYINQIYRFICIAVGCLDI